MARSPLPLIGTAVEAACQKIKAQLLELAQSVPNSPLRRLNSAQLQLANGQIQSVSDPSRSVSIVDAMRRAQSAVIEAEATTKPSRQQQRYSRYTHSAIFAEVKIDETFGTIIVSRIVSAIAAGRILNPKTARSQVIGGIVWGISSALEEESVLDHKLGRFMNHNFAEYHIPVNADVHEIDVIFVEEQDSIVNPLGAKGLGEIGVVGVAAAIANAVYHATGRRIRELPITLDRVFPHLAAIEPKVFG